MKNKMKFLGRNLLMLSFSCLPLVANTPGVPWYTPPKPGTDAAYDDATFVKLKSLKVSVHWHTISLNKALEDLSSQSQQVDPGHLGIKFIVKAPFNTQKVDMTIIDVSIQDILGYLSAQTNLGIEIHKGEVVLLPLKDANKTEQ